MYEKCPASYEWQYVLGHKEEFSPGPAALRGLEIHQSIEEHYTLGSPLHVEIPETVKPWLLEHLDKGCEAMPEMGFAFNKDWEVCEFDDEDAYIRGYMDNVFVYEDPTRIYIHEYKTGQIYDDHVDQKAFYAMAALMLWPDIKDVEVKGIYIDKKKQFNTKYSRMHLHSMQYTWKRRIDKMVLPLYPTRPGRHCMWCPKSKKKGGTCLVG